jgi:drug/metabolite transporter (DMT)-like permease
MSHLIGVLWVFLAACSFGAGAILIKLAYVTGLQPSQLLPLQNLVSILCLWPLLLMGKGFPKLHRADWLKLILQGLLGNFAISVCYFWSAQRIDVSLLSIILFTYPGFVLLYAMGVEKHRATAGECAALFLALGGGALAVGPLQTFSGSMNRWGLILAVGAAISYAFMNIHGARLARDLSSMAITTITSTVSTLALAAVLPPEHWISLPLSATQWLHIIGLALLSTVLPLNLLYLGIRRIGAFHASLISVAELPCILVLAFFLLGERINTWQMVGAGMIVLGLIVMQPPGIRRAGATPPQLSSQD